MTMIKHHLKPQVLTPCSGILIIAASPEQVLNMEQPTEGSSTL